VHAATRRAFNNNKLVLGWGYLRPQAQPEFIIKRQNAGKAFASSCHRCKIFVYHIAIIAAGDARPKSSRIRGRGFVDLCMCTGAGRGIGQRPKGSSDHRSIGQTKRKKIPKGGEQLQRKRVPIEKAGDWRLKTGDRALKSETPKTKD